MTSNHREPRLPERAEELLEGWPAPSRGALEWEESASSVLNRVRRTEIGSTPDDLLGAPLPEEPDERGRGAPEILAAEPSPAEPSLADIARAALSAREATTREVARAGLIAAELGRKNPPREVTPAPRALVDAASLQGRIARIPEPAPAPPEADRPPPPPKIAKEAEHTAVQIAEATAHSELPAPPSPGRRRLGAILGSSVLAFAAATALYLSFARHETPEARLTASAEVPAAPLAKSDPPAPQPSSPNEKAEATPSSSAVEQPVAKLDDTALAGKSRASAASVLPSKEKTLSFHVKKESSPNAGKLVLEEQNDAPTENAAPSKAGSAMQTTSSTMPTTDTPSTGAVQAALGSVLTSARGCLAGQDTGARARVTFEGRTGRVKSVSIDGAEPGSPAETCVRSALMGARLPPFSEPTFTASITVRPL